MAQNETINLALSYDEAGHVLEGLSLHMADALKNSKNGVADPSDVPDANFVAFIHAHELTGKIVMASDDFETAFSLATLADELWHDNVGGDHPTKLAIETVMGTSPVVDVDASGQNPINGLNEVFGVDDERALAAILGYTTTRNN